MLCVAEAPVALSDRTTRSLSVNHPDGWDDKRLIDVIKRFLSLVLSRDVFCLWLSGSSDSERSARGQGVCVFFSLGDGSASKRKKRKAGSLLETADVVNEANRFSERADSSRLLL